ncbi:hypothetical protein E2C01_011513 [Portunus trituberculatus]|uniref:Uncharacterized protein n=1 Tax=Portunus trituberculatus TaxID=210409 RepID=A0A5B7DC62_PORTR|nr:hypothetical protein [Portunus trituberculatus]
MRQEGVVRRPRERHRGHKETGDGLLGAPSLFTSSLPSPSFPILSLPSPPFQPFLFLPPCPPPRPHASHRAGNGAHKVITTTSLRGGGY